MQYIEQMENSIHKLKHTHTHPHLFLLTPDNEIFPCKYQHLFNFNTFLSVHFFQNFDSYFV